MLKNCICYTQKSPIPRYFLTCILFIIFCSFSFAQAPDTLWTKLYGGIATESTESMHQVYDGGYFIAGWTDTYGAGDFDVYLIRTDSIGDTMWTKVYGGTYDEFAYASLPTVDGGFIIVGESGSQNYGNPDVYIIRTDSIGDTLWTRTHISDDSEYMYSICPAADNGFILAGDIIDEAGDPDLYLMKINDTGDTVWTEKYGYPEEWALGREIIRAHDSGYVVCGATIVNDSLDVWLLKIDENGDTLWSRTFGYTVWDIVYQVEVTSDNGYVMVGQMGAWGVTDVCLIKTDSLGNEQWHRSYGDFGADAGLEVRQMDDDGYLIAGYISSFGAGCDAYIVRTNSIGDTLWTSKYGGYQYDEACPMTLTHDGGFAVAGPTSSFGAGSFDIWLLKFEQEPQFINEFTYSHTDQPKYPTVFSGPLRLPEDGNYKIYDITGRETAAHDMKPGVYFIKFSEGAIQKVIKLK